MRHQAGLGLSELLIALFLSTFLMIVLVQHYVTTKKQYNRLQTNLEARIDLQLVTELIRNSVRKAGFTPCLPLDYLITVDRRSNRHDLVGIEVSSDTQASLFVNRMHERFDTLLHTVSSSELLTTAIQTLHRHQSIIIADCYHAEVQDLSEVNHLDAKQRLTLTQPLAFKYHKPIYIGEWVHERYFIRQDKTGKRSLFYQRHHAEALTTAIQSLSVHINQDNGRQLVDIELGLENLPSLVLKTRVRAR